MQIVLHTVHCLEFLNCNSYCRPQVTILLQEPAAWSLNVPGAYAVLTVQS